MLEKITFDQLFVIVPLILGIIIGGIVIPRMMLVTVKNDWGKQPDDIDKNFYTALQVSGMSLFPVWLFTLCVSVLVPIYLGDGRFAPAVYEFVPRALFLISGATVLYIVGLKYDLNGSSSFVRMVSVIIAACLLSSSGLCIANFHGMFNIHEVPLWLGFGFTLLIIVGLIEVVKLLDGMEGLAGVTSIIVYTLVLIVALVRDDIIVAMILAGALGTVLPLSVMKLTSPKWRKTIMGNSGCYLLGYVMAYAVVSMIEKVSYVSTGKTVVILFSILMMPVLDVLRVVVSRIRDGRSVITPDRNQINFKLLRTGLPAQAIYPVYILLIIFFAVATWLMIKAGLDNTIVLIIDIAMWVASELIMNYFIYAREKRSQKEKWNKVYGRDAWNANVPYAQIEAKQKTFGNMGLKPEFINGTELDFIPDGMSKMENFVKRTFDICVSGFCLVVFSPLCLLSYLLIKLDDGGPAIFSQERIGRFGRPFNIYKYRSMRLDAEAMGPQLSHAGGDDDPRLTKVGRFLRAHHLDELPQLWNVFRGDMTLIGYRPERKFYIDQIMEHDPRYAFLYQIRPGVTSYATLYNGYTDTMEKMLRRLELDLYYLAHRSMWFDCKILFLTFISIIFGKKF